MANNKILDVNTLDIQDYNSRTGYGYYNFKVLGVTMPIVKYVLSDGFHIHKIDDIEVLVFMGPDDEWWIGADWPSQQRDFGLMGPYPSVEEAYLMMLLHCK